MYEEIKDRLLIASGISTYDTSLGYAEDEAERYVIMAIQKYEPAFTTVSGVLVDVVNDIAAGIFKRRQMPQDMDTGWWAQGLKKLNDYIWDVYDEIADPKSALVDAQIALLEAQAGLTTAQTTKLSTVDTTKVTNESAVLVQQASKLTAETAILQKEIDADTIYFCTSGVG